MMRLTRETILSKTRNEKLEELEKLISEVKRIVCLDIDLILTELRNEDNTIEMPDSQICFKNETPEEYECID